MDIAQSGVREPVILYEGKIIEGRVRYRAALDVDTEPQFRDWVLLGENDVLDWMVRHHVETHELSELEIVALVAATLPHYHKRPGSTHTRLSRATGLSIRKVRVIDYLAEAGVLEPVLAGEKEVLDAGREVGLVPNKRGVLVGQSYGAGDKFDKAVLPLKRYLSAWKLKGYEFRHLNPKEASRRLSLIDSLIEELQAARPDLAKRAVSLTYSAPTERRTKP